MYEEDIMYSFFFKYRFCICKYLTKEFSDLHYSEQVLAKLLYLCFVHVPVFYHSGKTKVKPKSSLKMAVFKEMFNWGFNLLVILLEREKK